MSGIDDLPQRIEVELNGVKTPWFVDDRYLRVFKGGEYGYRCLVAIGPRDFSKVAFFTTVNARDMAWRRSRAAGEEFVVHEAHWSRVRLSEIVLDEVETLLGMASRHPVDGWTTIPHQMLRPLIDRAATRAEVDGMFHDEFTPFVLANETFRMRSRLKRSGLAADIADRYVVI